MGEIEGGRLRPHRAVATVALMAGLVVPVDLAYGTATTRVLTLVEDARDSVCFLAPVRPPGQTPGQTPGSPVAAAALRGEPAAMLRMAEGFLAEPGADAARQGLAWLERAAAGGIPSAAGKAGQAHAAGRGTPPDPDRAAAWWRYGASLGDTRSMACLSATHLLGRGVPANPVEAARWAVLRDARNGGRSLLRPTSVEFEQALPASEMLAARRLATEPTAVAAAPEPSSSHAAAAPVAAWPMPVPASPTQPQLGPVAIWPAMWGGGTPVSLPRPPPVAKQGDPILTGTGLVVAAPGVVLTAMHVVQGCTELEVQAGLARFGGAEIRAMNTRLDLALLVVPGLDRTALAVGTGTRLGAEVALLGFPGQGILSSRPTVTTGNVSVIGVAALAEFMQFTAPTQGGNSGGPLLDRQGMVVGIVVASRNAIGDLVAGRNLPQNVNFAVAPALVSNFLADHGVRTAQEPLASGDWPTIAEAVERSIVRVVCHRTRRSPVESEDRSPGTTASARR